VPAAQPECRSLAESVAKLTSAICGERTGHNRRLQRKNESDEDLYGFNCCAPNSRVRALGSFATLSPWERTISGRPPDFRSDPLETFVGSLGQPSRQCAEQADQKS
jgi:hypothetical protein